MSAPAAMALPGGRVVLNWWRDLAGLSPRRICFAHLILHQVEVLVEAAQARPLEPLAEQVWARLSRQGEPVAFDALVASTALDAHLLHAVLDDLAARGLAEPSDGGWRGKGEGPALSPVPTATERRTFTFADARPPVFLPLPPGLATPLPPPPGWRFDLGGLLACIGQSPEWKARHGFPAGVVRLVPPGTEWRGVALDQPGQTLLLFVEVADEVLAYAVRPDTWTLGGGPAFRCPADVLAALGGEPGAEGWRQAWQAWSQQRSLPGGEVEACRLEAVGHRLVVRAPARLVERLKSARSDALKGEAFVLAGGGRVRAAAMLDVVEG
jgi:hypothetical protein